MARVKVLKPFHDLKEGVDRAAGDRFTCTEERYAELVENLAAFGGGYVEQVKRAEKETKVEG